MQEQSTEPRYVLQFVGRVDAVHIAAIGRYDAIGLAPVVEVDALPATVDLYLAALVYCEPAAQPLIRVRGEGLDWTSGLRPSEPTDWYLPQGAAQAQFHRAGIHRFDVTADQTSIGQLVLSISLREELFRRTAVRRESPIPIRPRRRPLNES
jgi:hypothetical protein